jgi:putative hemolysin
VIGSVYTAIVGRALSKYSRAKLDDLLEKEVPPDHSAAVAARLERTLNIDETLMLTAYALRAVINLTLAGLVIHSLGTITDWRFWLGVGLFVILVEVVPKAFATAFALALVWKFAALFRWSLLPFLPLGGAILATNRFLVRALGKQQPETEEEELEDRIRSLVREGESEGVLEEETQEIIESALEMQERRVSEIMTPRTELFFIEVSTPLHEAARLAYESGHSRIPVYEETRDNILGVFYVKDLLPFWDPEARNGVVLRQVLRRPMYVPETSKVDDLLLAMRRQRTHIAIVTDEYGGTAGVVTVEDALEELVGEIHDEYDRSAADPSFQKIDDYTSVADGRVHLVDIADDFGVALPAEEDIVTLGGFITSYLGHIPKNGETFRFGDVEIVVLEADDRRVLRVKLTKSNHERVQEDGK